MKATSKWIAPLGAVAVLGAALFAPALLMSATAQTFQPGQRTTPDPRLRTVLFAADMVVDVPVRRGQITQIVLGDDEQIVGIPISGKGSNCSDEIHTGVSPNKGATCSSSPSRARPRRTSSSLPTAAGTPSCCTPSKVQA